MCLPIEVGCRGFVATSLVSAFGKLGNRSKHIEKQVLGKWARLKKVPQIGFG